MLSLQSQLQVFLDSLHQARVTYFPVRHHSPACAWHLQHLIQAEPPDAILIEGPADATGLIPHLVNSQSQTPFALYTTYIDKAGWVAKAAAAESEDSNQGAEPPRFAGYYPFCDYSPELVALREGQRIGATLRFIDLTYPELVIASAGATQNPDLRALQAEQYLRRSAYLNALAQKTGCRDADDLWDHLFEAPCQTVDTLTFIHNVATYCYMARQDATPETLEAEGNVAREGAMAVAIAQSLKEFSGRILVVTGGFHTVVLPSLVENPPQRTAPPTLLADVAQTVLMRYSFEQLDALNGYGSGMPAPAYYQQLWQQMVKAAEQPANSQTAPTQPTTQTACDLLLTIRQLTCQQNTLTPLSVADEIAALVQAQRLAQFRDHPGPTREDLLDAVRSCFVKGDMDGTGGVLMALVKQVLQGDAVGELPPDVGVPPLVEDFRYQAKQLRLELKRSVPKQLKLDLYRKGKHRQTSRFLHQLRFLEIPFARKTGGPDFVLGTRLDQLFEQWDYRWTPQTESELIERSLYGTTVLEAVQYGLRKQIANLAEEGNARSAKVTVDLLIQACRMGLQAHTEKILSLIDEHIATDADFNSLVQATRQLLLLWQSREPLEAHDLSAVPALMALAYRRLCYLLPQLSQVSLEESRSILQSFQALWELLTGAASDALDVELFIEGLLTLLTHTQGNPVVLGGAVGILYHAHRLDAETLVTLAVGYLDHAMADAASGIGFLRGVLYTCREVSWTLPALIEAINARLVSWDEDEFLKVLPELRLAFADLIPRETDRVAEQVAQLHGQETLGNLINYQATEADLQLGVQIERLMQKSLIEDGLEEWVMGNG